MWAGIETSVANHVNVFAHVIRLLGNYRRIRQPYYNSSWSGDIAELLGTGQTSFVKIIAHIIGLDIYSGHPNLTICFVLLEVASNDYCFESRCVYLMYSTIVSSLDIGGGGGGGGGAFLYDVLPL